MRIEFDESKSQRNARERRLPFTMAAELDFATASVTEDRRSDYPERRFVAFGYIERRLHVLCFAETETRIRVISFRRANAREVKRYAKTQTADR